MTQTLPKLLTFAEFVAWLPDQGRYELHNGVIFPMNPPVGFHEDIKCFLITELAYECKRLKLPYGISNQSWVKSPQNESAYLPDILLINREILATDSIWQKSAIISRSDAIPLIIEVVSTNWEDDYYKKLGDFEKLGVPEYWIVDYLALGARRFIGNPKQPTISVHSLFEGEYQLNQFRDNEKIISPTFPELNLTANQIFQASV